MSIRKAYKNKKMSRIRHPSTGLLQVFITATLEFYKCLQIINMSKEQPYCDIFWWCLNLLFKYFIKKCDNILDFYVFETKKINEGAMVIKDTVSLVQNEKVGCHKSILVQFFHSELKLIKNTLFYITLFVYRLWKTKTS